MSITVCKHLLGQRSRRSFSRSACGLLAIVFLFGCRAVPAVPDWEAPAVDLSASVLNPDFEVAAQIADEAESEPVRQPRLEPVEGTTKQEQSILIRQASFEAQQPSFEAALPVFEPASPAPQLELEPVQDNATQDSAAEADEPSRPTLETDWAPAAMPTIESAADPASESVIQPVAEVTAATVTLPWQVEQPTPAEELPTLANLPVTAWPMTLDDAIFSALENTTVLRTLGAQLLNNPDSARTAFDPWVDASDPRSGTAAALADFDANVNARINYANNDDVLNNATLGGGTNQIQQDLATSLLQWQKFTRTGAQYSLTGAIDYDDNDRPANLFPSVYNTRLEAQLRQPLLQGRGELFNAIAGPTGRVDRQGGTGILLAQANVDASVVQFERDVTGFVNEVISAYWNLYLAYRNVEIARDSYQQAKQTWLATQAKKETGLQGGEAYREAQAREQMNRAEVQYLESIHSTGESGAIGLLQSEARLRLLLQLSSDASVLIYPTDTLVGQSTVFDVDRLHASAIELRAEIREQSIQIRRDELQLLAARNFLLPRLDAVAVYRNNGFGDTLGLGDADGFENALDVAAEGRYDEWEVGLQYNLTLGRRRAQTGVRNSCLRLKRRKSVLDEMCRRVRFEIDTALRSVARSELTLEAAQRLRDAADQSYRSQSAAFESGFTNIDELLRAQQRLADAQRTYYRQAIDRTLSVESVFRETGSLLQMHGVKSDRTAFDTCPSCPTLSSCFADTAE